MLSKVLMNKQFHHPGTPANYLPLSSTSSSVTSSSVSSESDVASIVLALRTLGSFNFDGEFLYTNTASVFEIATISILRSPL